MFFIIFFSFCIKFCQVFWGGGQAPQARVSSPPGGGGKLPRVRGIPRGIFTPEGDKLNKGSFTPRVGRGRGKLPGFQDKPIHRFGMFICTHCSLVHARVQVITLSYWLITICRQNFVAISCYYYVSLHKFKLWKKYKGGTNTLPYFSAKYRKRNALSLF